MANPEVDIVDFEPEDDDLMEEEGAIDEAPHPKIRSAITGGSSFSAPKKTKGRGFREETEAERNNRFASKDFDSLDSDGGPGPQRSIEGWIILVAGVHEEAQEDDLQNAFGEFGEVRNLHLNLDRRTGFVKVNQLPLFSTLQTSFCNDTPGNEEGYALIEYGKFEEAQAAISGMDGVELLTQIVTVDWAFSNGPFKRRNMRKRFVALLSSFTFSDAHYKERIR
ncbi:hypothetical protein GIB67_042076 [Kingdonia uniflora]|uniref:RRM domain-containing protein n=1 Tax=Kingdonia uniflora TaxID=39325 RepID=A0A7J7MVQ8_9MAGN|nr:hypothetical protein GIB67_042076 [Kingdonia uniflora]